MATLTELARTAEFIQTLGNGHISIDAVNVVGGVAPGLKAGAVLGKLTAGGNYVAYASGGADGSQTVAGILYEAQIGTAIGAVVTRNAEVKRAKLVYTGTQATVEAGLLALGIVTRA